MDGLFIEVTVFQQWETDREAILQRVASTATLNTFRRY